jgi:23S rRNA U2552 (ribose-2'-O)-methylase RlmE/FtsJ
MAATTVIEGATTPTNVSSPKVAISNRLHLSKVNPNISTSVLQEQLKIVFSRFGTVQEVFLSTRSEDHYGFVVMGSKDEAQRALDELHPNVGDDQGGVTSSLSTTTLTLFHGVDAATDFVPRNKRALRNLQQSVQDYQDRLELAKTSTIICQVHKSHEKRIKDFLVADQNDVKSSTIELVGSFIPESSRNITLVFLKPSSTTSKQGQLQEEEDETATGDDSNDDDEGTTRITRTLWSKWYMASAIHRITILDKSLPSGLGVVQGSLDKVVIPAIYHSIKESLLRDAQQYLKETVEDDTDYSKGATTREKTSEIDNNLCLIRLAVFPPKLQTSLLEEVGKQFESTFLPMLLAAESEHSTTGILTGTSSNNNCRKKRILPTVKFSPTNATHTLAITMLHEGIRNIYQNDGEDKQPDVSAWSSGPPPPTTRGRTGALYALGKLERIVIVNGTKNTKPDSDDNSNVDRSNQNNNNYNRNDNTRNANETSISRAYWKLQEAWERYKYCTPTKGLRGSNNNKYNSRNLDVKGDFNIRALDCGSAPGGWTKFLYDQYHCDCIYSVDPGELAPQVLDLDSFVIRHMPCTIQQAFVQLVQDRDSHRQQEPLCHVSESTGMHKTYQEDDDAGTTGDRPFLDIWVSDMCVKHMPAQVDLFLEALRLGLVGPGTFFVLTLKCVMGYSHTTFDMLVQEQVNRLVGGNHPTTTGVPAASSSSGGTNHGYDATLETKTHDIRKTSNSTTVGGGPSLACRDVQVLHLFANRNSERTIVGYLC